jgi:ketosteroid isomerase-like protein
MGGFGLALRSFAAVVSVMGVAAAQEPPAPQPSQPAPMTADECAVWAREKSFAESLARHDIAGFAAHVHPGAAFIGEPDQIARGRDAVVQEWTPLIEGKDAVLRWYPRTVTIAGEPRIALSRGPYWLEDPRPDANPRYRIGQFISTWIKGDDGEWHVLYDGGGGGVPRAATAEEVERLKASLPQECPRA